MLNPLPRAAIETLEQRKLLAFSPVKINFQPAGSPVPAGYLVDSGLTYAARNGQSYGFDRPATNTRDRNDGHAPDQRYDTLTHLTATWELAVPNGNYDVRIVAGDPGYTDSIHRINVEGVRALDFTPSAANRFGDATVTVAVTDGKLTLAAANDAFNPKIDFVEVSDAGGTPPPPPPPTNTDTLKFNFQNASAPVPTDYTADTGLGYRAQGSLAFGWNTDATSFGRDRNKLADQRVDTLTHFNYAGRRNWDVSLPNGTYTVVAVVGDPAYPDESHHLLAEGVTIVNGSTSRSSPTLEGTVTVAVTDGKLTLTSAGNGQTKLNYIHITPDGAPPPPPPPPPPPTSGPRINISRVEAEDYHRYQDATAGNAGGAYRSDDVDIVTGSAGTFVGYTQAGEWLEWDVTVPTAGRYNLALRGASGSSGGVVGIKLDGSTIATFNLGGTGGWETFTNFVANNINLPVGNHTLRLDFLSATRSGQDIANIDSLTFTPAGTAATGTLPTLSWTTSTMSTRRYEGASVQVDGQLFVFGGFAGSNDYVPTRDSQTYDISTGTFTRIADLPTDLTHAAPVLVDGVIYLIGGFLGESPGPATADVWAYDITSNTYSQTTSLPRGIGGGAAAAIGRKLHYVAEQKRISANHYVNGTEHWVLDLNNLTAGWTRAADLPTPRNHLGMVNIGGQLYAVGGEDGDAEFTGNMKDLERYDPATDRWTRLADLPAGRGHLLTNTVIDGNGFMIVGGAENSSPGRNQTDEVFRYDIATNTWTFITRMPGERKSPMAAYYNGTLVALGGAEVYGTNTVFRANLGNSYQRGPDLPAAVGEVAGGVIGNDLFIVGDGSTKTFAYNLGTGTWRDVNATRPTPGKDQTAAVVNGKLYIFGGIRYNSSGMTVYNRTQVYNPANNSWATLADMPFAAAASQTVAMGGKIYVAGGVTTGNFTTTRVAVYDVASNAWTERSAMPLPRNSAPTGTDGRRLFLFGGRDGGDEPGNGFADTLIYDTATDTWSSGTDLPKARGGIVNAPLINGEFYIIGGETEDDPDAGPDRVYERVDIYNPLTNTWRRGDDLPAGRHGIFPLAVGPRLYLAGGGVVQGASNSVRMDIINLG